MRYALALALLLTLSTVTNSHEVQGYVACDNLVLEYPSNSVQLDENGDIWLQVEKYQTFNPTATSVWLKFNRSDCVFMEMKE